MKNIFQQNHNTEYGIFNYDKMEAKILDFLPQGDSHYTLRLKLSHLKRDNYRLIFNNNQLTVFIFESIEFSKPVHLHNYKLHDLVENPTYDELKSFDFTLPTNDFYLIGHNVIPNKGILNVTFGKIHHN